MKKITTILGFLVVIFFLTSCIGKNNQDKPIDKNNIEADVYDEYYISKVPKHHTIIKDSLIFSRTEEILNKDNQYSIRYQTMFISERTESIIIGFTEIPSLNWIIYIREMFDQTDYLSYRENFDSDSSFKYIMSIGSKYNMKMSAYEKNDILEILLSKEYLVFQ